jgi:hypothetical protein
MQELLFGRDVLWFSIPALVGTFFFLFRTIIMLVGGGFDLHHDTGDASFDLDHSDSSGAFKVLSIQAIAAFSMGFGWVGLGVVRGWGLSPWLGVAAGLAGGTGMMWLLGKLLRWIARLQSSGTLDISGALTEEGTVYITIPAHRQGRGRVRVVMGDQQRYYSAITDGDTIASNRRVRVTEVNDDNTLTVELVSESLSPGPSPPRA